VLRGSPTVAIHLSAMGPCGDRDKQGCASERANEPAWKSNAPGTRPVTFVVRSQGDDLARSHRGTERLANSTLFVSFRAGTAEVGSWISGLFDRRRGRTASRAVAPSSDELLSVALWLCESQKASLTLAWRTWSTEGLWSSATRATMNRTASRSKKKEKQSAWFPYSSHSPQTGRYELAQ
jgi:hypothetical protein